MIRCCCLFHCLYTLYVETSFKFILNVLHCVQPSERFPAKKTGPICGGNLSFVNYTFLGNSLVFFFASSLLSVVDAAYLPTSCHF